MSPEAAYKIFRSDISFHILKFKELANLYHIEGRNKQCAGVDNKEIFCDCSQHDEAMTLRCLLEILSSVGTITTFHTAFVQEGAAVAVVSHNALFVSVCVFVRLVCMKVCGGSH